jgi:predicted nicotinamide N-methyase
MSFDRSSTSPRTSTRPDPATRRSRLLARINRRWETVTEEIDLQWMSLRFTRIADPDRVLDEAAEAEERAPSPPGQPLPLPYWAELWDSAPGIARFLLREVHESRLGRQPGHVLDLGCGMGFTGCVAAALGHHVTFADLELHSLLFALLNSLHWRPRVDIRRLDWQKDRLKRSFDQIIGADILYERSQWEFLEPFWKQHLSAGGRIILGEPGRQTGDAFSDWILPRGWQLSRHEEPVPTREQPIRIFVLTRSS